MKLRTITRLLAPLALVLALPHAASADETVHCAGLAGALTAATSGDVITLDETCPNMTFTLPSVPITLQAAAPGDGFDGAAMGFPMLFGANMGETTIKGLTFKNGNAGAIYIHGTSAPHIVDNVFENNATSDRGGAVDITVGMAPGTVTVEGNQFGFDPGTGNSAALGGGGLNLSAIQMPMTVSGNRFVGNKSATQRGGGALLLAEGPGATSTVANNVFAGNSVTSGISGAGLNMFFQTSSPAVLSGNQFLENILNANGSDGPHGAGLEVVNESATPAGITQLNNLFDGNVISAAPGGESGGAGEWIAGLPVTSTNDRFISNTIQMPGGEGGGVGVEGESSTGTFQPGELHATNLVADGNRLAESGVGAGIYAGTLDFCTLADCPSVLELNDSTVAGNCVAPGGGSSAPGIAGSGLDKLTLRNSIVYNGQATVPCSSPGFLPDVSGFSEPATSVSSTDLCNGPGGTNGPVAGAGNVCADPRLLNPQLGDFHETAASPTINKGNNALVTAGLTTDLDGQPRIGSGVVDMGADEFATAGAAKDMIKPRFGILRQTLRADSKGRVKIKLRCVEQTRCIGTVTLTTSKPVIATARKRKAKKLKLGSKRFNVAGGSKTRTVTIKLSKRARKLLARKHSLKVVARVTGKDTAGNAARAVKRTLTLKRAHVKKKRR